MKIILKERNNEKHFISIDRNLAYAYASYYTKPCGELHYINGEKRLCKIYYDTDIKVTKQNGDILEFEAGDYFVIYDEKENLKSISGLNYLQKLREENKLEKHFICTTEESFLSLD